MRDRLQFPEPEVAREEQHALALGIRQSHALVAFVLRTLDHLFRCERAEGQQLQQHLAEVRKRRPGDGAALRQRALGEALLEIGERDAPVGCVENIEHQPQRAAPQAHHAVGQSPRDLTHRDDGPVFEGLAHQRTALTDSKSASAGSNVTTSGTRYSANGSSPSASKRTASLSVVNTASAPACCTLLAMRSTSARE